MCHAVLEDPAFFRLLTRIDEEFAAATQTDSRRLLETVLPEALAPATDEERAA